MNVTITKPWPVVGKGVCDVLPQKNSFFSHRKVKHVERIGDSFLRTKRLECIVGGVLQTFLARHM